jgi:uncharacterized protein
MWVAAPALAHVTVSPEEASKGGFTELSFSVPNERAVDTVRLEVALPADHPIANVSVQPKTGWTYTVEKGAPAEPLTAHGEAVAEIVTRVVWEGGTIKPGEYDRFNLSVGPLPEDADQLIFPALQTYADGEVVRWIEEPAASGEEPERPAPVLALVDAGEHAHGATGDDEATSTTEAGDEAADEPAVEAPSSQSSDDGDSKGLAIGALAVSAVALIGAGAAMAGARGRAPKS